MRPVDLQLPYTHTELDLIEAFARKAGIPAERAARYAILRKSIDARKKSDIRIVYQVAEQAELPSPIGVAGLLGSMASVVSMASNASIASIESTAFTASTASAPSPPSSESRIVVVGAGPAGLFATLYLALAGLRPLLVERGQPVERRQQDVARFWSGGALDPESNVQFGEGGAGTFSDGKLTTGIRDPRCRAVLEELVLLGGPPEILFLAKPHVGTDRLRSVVLAMRQKILSLGGEIRFGTRLTGLVSKPDPADGTRQRLTGVVLSSSGPKTRTDDGSSSGDRSSDVEVPASTVILAIGHSARDTFHMLRQTGLTMTQKPFAVGVRIEHNQHLIDQTQYGQAAGHPNLPPAEYKLACPLSSGRNLYTFCMCPGGQVIASASADGEVVTNGMSHFSRDGMNANSALLVPVGPEDFESADPLAGVAFQQRLERLAFQAGGGRHRAPAQRVGDFLGNSHSWKIVLPHSSAGSSENRVDPSYTNGVTFSDLADVLPAFVTEGLREGLPLLAGKLRGFADPDAVMTGVETRSSSPVRLVRDETLQSSLAGLYPCGEGAGYAGGIMSAAVDGLRCAEAVLSNRSGSMDDNRSGSWPGLLSQR